MLKQPVIVVHNAESSNLEASACIARVKRGVDSQMVLARCEKSHRRDALVRNALVGNALVRNAQRCISGGVELTTRLHAIG
jgi:hypothetical protein